MTKMKRLFAIIFASLAFASSAFASPSPYKDEDPRVRRFAASAASAYCLFANGVATQDAAFEIHMDYVKEYGYTDEEIERLNEDPLVHEMAEWSIQHRPC